MQFAQYLHYFFLMLGRHFLFKLTYQSYWILQCDTVHIITFSFSFPDTWKSFGWWSDTCKCSACRQRYNALFPTWRAWKVCIYNYLYFINDLFLDLVTILCNQPLITNTCPSRSKIFPGHITQSIYIFWFENVTKTRGSSFVRIFFF